MSINITLHGNSFYNNRENRMLGNLDYAKKQELDRRKRLRLEQVKFDENLGHCRIALTFSFN